MTDDTKKIIVIVLASCLVIFAVLLGGIKVFDLDVPIVNPHNPELVLSYGNNEVNEEDDDPTNNMNFGRDRYTPAQDSVAKGEYANEIDYYLVDMRKSSTAVYTSEEEPNPEGSDPALLLAWALHADNVLTLPDGLVLLQRESKLPIGQRVDGAHKRILKNPADWDWTAGELLPILLDDPRNTYQVIEVTKYSNMMYMVYSGLGHRFPSVVVRENTIGTTGFDSDGNPIVLHALVITTPYGVFAVMLECGYQPFNLTYWPTPAVIIPATPTPTPTPSRDISQPEETSAAVRNISQGTATTVEQNTFREEEKTTTGGSSKRTGGGRSTITQEDDEKDSGAGTQARTGDTDYNQGDNQLSDGADENQNVRDVSTAVTGTSSSPAAYSGENLKPPVGSTVDRSQGFLDVAPADSSGNTGSGSSGSSNPVVREVLQESTLTEAIGEEATIQIEDQSVSPSTQNAGGGDSSDESYNYTAEVTQEETSQLTHVPTAESPVNVVKEDDGSNALNPEVAAPK